MSVNVEVSEILKKPGAMYNWASKVTYRRELNDEESEISKVVDAWAKEIGRSGYDPKHEIANYIVKTIQPEVYDKPDALLSLIFNRGAVGEFDDFEIDEIPGNTLKPYDAAHGGNVPKSYLDIRKFQPRWFHKQVETEVRYSELRRGGYRSIANLTTFAKESLLNSEISEVFNDIDDGITGGDQVIANGGDTLTKVALDKLALYVIDRVDSGDSPLAFGLNKYAQAIANMAGYSSYMSNNMKEEFNRYGLIRDYNGLSISGISGAKKTATGELLIPDKRIFGVAGKIGELDTRGEIRVYETPDNNQEKMNLKITGFEFGYAITHPEKVAKITMNA